MRTSVKKMALANEAIVVQCLFLCKNHLESVNFELAHPIKEEEKMNISAIWRLLWFGTFTMLFCATRHVVHHENT